MISLQKGFLFVHIPKTAGNSIQSALRDYSEDQLVPARREQDGVERFGLQFRNLYKFSCVRNPWVEWCRIISRPRKIQKPGTGKKFRGIISKAVSVSDYLRLHDGEEDPFANVNYIMGFENLADDFRAVCVALDIQARQLPRYNRSTHGAYSKCYDVHLRELVREGFAAEIEQFGYTFD
jgi:hypothetical protein